MLMGMRRSSSRAFASAIAKLKAQYTFTDGASVDEACNINIYNIPPAVGISFQLFSSSFVTALCTQCRSLRAIQY